MKEVDWQLFSWLVFPFLDSSCLIGSNEYHLLHIFAITSFSLPQSSCYELYFYFRNFSYKTITKNFPSNATKKSVVKIVEHKLDEPFSDGTRGDIQLGCFILLSVPISQQLPRLTFLYFFSVLKWPLRRDCTFCWQNSSAFDQSANLQSWKLFSRK